MRQSERDLLLIISNMRSPWGGAITRPIHTFSDKELKEGYVFHVLTSKIFSKEECDRLEKLCNLLSNIYPCEIVFHVVNDLFFIENRAPIWRGNYQAYFRYFVSDFVGEEVNVALYLDIDMLVLDDIRKLWVVDIDQKVMMVARLPAVFKADEFNSGFIFFNVKRWRKEGWKYKCLEYTKKNKALDQDTLNRVVKREQIMIVSQRWDYCFQTYQSDSELLLSFDKKEDLLKNLKIIHYIRPKPWGNIMDWFYRSRGRCLKYQGIIDLWWDNALRTPLYSSELFDLKLQINRKIETSVNDYFGGVVFFIFKVKKWIRKNLGCADK